MTCAGAGDLLPKFCIPRTRALFAHIHDGAGETSSVKTPRRPAPRLQASSFQDRRERVQVDEPAVPAARPTRRGTSARSSR